MKHGNAHVYALHVHIAEKGVVPQGAAEIEMEYPVFFNDAPGLFVDR